MENGTKTGTEKGIVMIVEDNAKILNINRRMLEKDGCMVVAAQTLAEARECLTAAVPDVAVLDIMLPDGSGLDFLAELRERWKCAAPVIFLTAKAESDDVLAGLSAGGIDCITKPYNIYEFRLRVTGLLQLVNSSRAENSLGVLASLLPQRELAIARFAAEGLSNKEIADKVYLSESRIKTSLTAIYRKLNIAGTRDKRQAIAKILCGG